MSDNNKTNLENNEINSTNIFDEFENEPSLVSDVKKLKIEQNKDVFFYISMTWKLLQNLFLVFLFFIIFAATYIYIQNDKTLENESLLNPICSLLNKTVPKPDDLGSCSSLSYTKNFYEEELKKLKVEVAQQTLSVLSILYEEKNFNKTKDVLFLLNKTDSKLSVLEILDKFNNLKLEFWWIDKRKVQCRNFLIERWDNTLSMKCEAFSKGFEKWIIWFSWDKSWNTIRWTSITIANSFINYIEKNTDDFTVIERQKVFNNISVVGEKNWYTNKTSFDVKLKINF